MRTVLACVVGLLMLAVSPGTVQAQDRLGLPIRGPEDARVVILLFSDFECPYCARVDGVLEEVRRAFPSDVQVVFKHNPLPIHPKAQLAHEASVEAARQGKFWEMHDRLFANQQRFDEAQLLEHAKELSLDVDAFGAALKDGRHRAAVRRDMAEATALGVNATPTLFVNGQRLVGIPSTPQLMAFVKSIVTGRPMTAPAEALPADALRLDGAPARGPADAPVTIVEFSDFQCPYCARARAVTEAVVAKYDGRVRWVFKHLPLDFHPDAPLAHRAAIAAGEQGRFWDMHAKIFENQRAMKRPDLLRMATELGLDVARFTADLDSERLDAIVARDVADASKVGIDGTPTFFVNGRRMVGVQTVEVLSATIDAELRVSAPVFTRPREGAEVPAATIDRALSRGPDNAPVTIEWFADVRSTLHRDAVVLLKRVLERHPDSVRLLYRHYPIRRERGDWLVLDATVAAAEQGRFWDIHDLLVTRPGQTKASLLKAAERLGLDADWFDEGLRTGRARAVVERQFDEAQRQGIRGAPTFLVNGVRIDGIVGIEVLESAVSDALAKVPARTNDARAAGGLVHEGRQ